VAPFIIEQKDDINGPWEDSGIYTMQRSVTLPVSGPTEFFRVQEQALKVTAEVLSDGAHISWLLPPL